MIIFDLLTLYAMIYIAITISFYIHEIFHFGDKVHFKFEFPIPKAWSFQSRWQYGGLISNAAIFLAVWYFKPQNIFLQLLGLVNWVFFIWYLFFNSFNFEPKVPQWMWRYVVFDDIPNEYWWLFVPLSIITLLYFMSFYFPIASNIFQAANTGTLLNLILNRG